MKTAIWNERCQVQLVNAARYYTLYFILNNFYQALFNPEHKLALLTTSIRKLSPESQHILHLMYRNFALNHYLNENPESFYINMPSQEYINHFSKASELYTRIYKDE